MYRSNGDVISKLFADYDKALRPDFGEYRSCIQYRQILSFVSTKLQLIKMHMTAAGKFLTQG